MEVLTLILGLRQNKMKLFNNLTSGSDYSNIWHFDQLQPRVLRD